MITYLIQSGDCGEWVWPTWRYYFTKYWKDQDIMSPLFIGETFHPAVSIMATTTGKVAWGQGMINVLTKLDSKYVVLTHEDYFINGPINFELLEVIAHAMTSEKIDLVKLCGAWAGWTSDIAPMTKSDIYINESPLWRYPVDRQYAISHQMSLWNREFLLSTIEPGYTPWSHEVVGSRAIAEEGKAVIYAYVETPPIPYVETCTVGKVRHGAEVYFTEAEGLVS